jgi:hypothetical protein
MPFQMLIIHGNCKQQQAQKSSIANLCQKLMNAFRMITYKVLTTKVCLLSRSTQGKQFHQSHDQEDTISEIYKNKQFKFPYKNLAKRTANQQLSTVRIICAYQVRSSNQFQKS